MASEPNSATAQTCGETRSLVSLLRSGCRFISLAGIVPRLLGVLLLVAAALKAHHLATHPVLESGLFDSRWFQIGWVEFELLFGAWLLTGWQPKATRVAALALFTLLAVVSLANVLARETSCGCFGALRVNPKYVLALEFFALILLFFASPRSSGGKIKVSQERDRLATLSRFAGFAVVFLGLGLPAGWAMATYSPATLTGDGQLLGNGEAVVLRPETWLGKPFPLLAYIEIGADLSKGDWIVVLHRAECAKCQDVISRYTALAREASAHDHLQIAFVRLPSLIKAAGSGIEYTSGIHLGSLRATRQWMIETPSVIKLRGGLIIAVEPRAGETTPST